MKKSIFAILILLSLVLTVLTCLAYLSPIIEPSNSGMTSLIGLFYPLLLLCNIFAILIWIALRSRWVILPIISMLLGVGHIGKVISLDIAHEPDANKTTIHLATYNANFSKPIFQAEPKYKQKMISDYIEFLKDRQDLSVLCVQEHGTLTQSIIAVPLSMPHYHTFPESTIAVYSQYPIIDNGMIPFNGNPANGCIWVDLDIGQDTLRVYTTHLESNRHDGVVPDKVEETAHENMSNKAILGILKYYSKFSQDRADQMKVIQQHRIDSGRLSIICGDLNDGPLSYMYKVAQKDMQDSFIKKGRGIGSTFGEKIPGLRIDYIFADPRFKILDHEIYHNDYSDHYMIEAVLEI